VRLRLVWFALVLATERVAVGFRALFRPAEVRRHLEPRRRLRLDQPYYAARGSRGYELVPKDAYLEEVEALLLSLERAD